jgi:hypothetical protein
MCSKNKLVRQILKLLANGTGNATFDTTMYVALNSTGGNFGFGAQGGDYDFLV